MSHSSFQEIKIHVGTWRSIFAFWRGSDGFFFMQSPLMRWLRNWYGIVMFS
jgi:hypothetical protein